MTKKILITLLLLAIVVEYVLKIKYLLIPLPIIAFVLGIMQFNSDRLELKAAKIYCRTERYVSGSKKFFSSKWGTVVVVLFIVFIVFMLYRFTNTVEFSTEFGLAIGLINISGYLCQYYANFTDSIRSFDQGIKLPGRNKTIIPWKKIKNIELDNQTVSVGYENGNDSWLLNYDDEADMKQMIIDWKKHIQNVHIPTN